MRAIDRHPNTSDRRAERRMMHNLPTLVPKFFLFLGVTGLKKDVDLRQNVESDRVRKHALLNRLTSQMSFGLTSQLRNRLSARARDSLITRCNHPIGVKGFVQRIKRH